MFYEDADVLICTSINSPINYPNIILKIGSLTGPFYEKSSYKLSFFLFKFSSTLLVKIFASMSKSRHWYSFGPTTFVSAFPMAIHNFMAPKCVAWTLVHRYTTNSLPKGLTLVVGCFFMQLACDRTDSATASMCEGTNPHHSPWAFFALVRIPFSATTRRKPSTWSFNALWRAPVSGFS